VVTEWIFFEITTGLHYPSCPAAFKSNPYAIKYISKNTLAAWAAGLFSLNFRHGAKFHQQHLPGFCVAFAAQAPTGCRKLVRRRKVSQGQRTRAAASNLGNPG
jgi:hypothetical protein